MAITTNNGWNDFVKAATANRARNINQSNLYSEQRAAPTFQQQADPSTLVAGSPIATGAAIDSATYNANTPYSSNAGLTNVDQLAAAATTQRFLQQLAAARTPNSLGRIARAVR